MKEILWEKGFWAAIAVSILGMAAGMIGLEIKPPLSTGSFVNFFKAAAESKILIFIIPITAVLPMGAIYVKEASGGFLKFYITRISRMEYILKKTVQIYMSGFMTLLLAGLGLFFACFLCFFPMEITGEIHSDMFLEAFLLLIRISMIGGIISEVSGIFSAAFCNYFMAYGMPFVCYYLLIILKERYLSEFYAFYPVEWIKCQQYWGDDNGGIWVFLVFLSAAVMLLNSLFLWLACRRFK